MRRLLVVGILALSAVCHAQEAEHKSSGPPEVNIAWKWANFALLAFIFYRLGAKHAGPFFAERSKAIQSGLLDAKKLREDSEARVLEIERRVASLETEMKELREASRHEMSLEAERIRTETARSLAKIQNRAEQEIGATVKLARQELKQYSADLAIQLATAQIRERLDGGAQQRLVDGFIRQLATSQKVMN